uniref:Uncharacterized protein n=1 Tax=Anguilla anguilla TaxID=7936 RepID=A0A0E9T490_ANGAN
MLHLRHSLQYLSVHYQEMNPKLGRGHVRHPAYHIQ